MPTTTSRAKKKTEKQYLDIGGKEYEFNAAPVAVMLMSQLKGRADGITNMDAAKWVLRSLSDEDAAEVLTRLETGEIEWDDFKNEIVPAAMELDNPRPTS